MTTDRELLEKAAKAAGIDLYIEWDGFGSPTGRYRNGVDGDAWNPLEDDGDALRLAVRKRFHINIFSACSAEGIDTPGFVEVWCGDCDPIHTEWVDGGDYETATRRAIVRAAAALGEQHD